MAELKVDAQDNWKEKRAWRRFTHSHARSLPTRPRPATGEAYMRACPAGLKYSRVVGLPTPPRVKPPAGTGAVEGRRIKRQPALTALDQEAGMARLAPAPSALPPAAGSFPAGLRYSRVMGLASLPRVKPPQPAACGEGKRVKKSLAYTSDDAEAVRDRLKPEGD